MTTRRTGKSIATKQQADKVDRFREQGYSVEVAIKKAGLRYADQYYKFKRLNKKTAGTASKMPTRNTEENTVNAAPEMVTIPLKKYHAMVNALADLALKNYYPN